jgi:gliding motility-associated lipoprotein GldH
MLNLLKLNIFNTKNNMQIKSFLFISLLTIGILSCSNENEILNDFQDLSAELEWKKSDVKIFEVESTSKSDFYKITVPFRYIEGFPYQYAKIRITEISPSGEETRKDYELKVREDSGDYIGDPGMDIWDSEHVIEDQFIFREVGRHTFKIEHNMPNDPLLNVLGIGLIIEKLK